MARKPKADMRCREVKSNIYAGLAMQGISVPELAKKTGISYPTLSRKMRTDEGIKSLSLSELWAIQDALEMN